MAVGVRADDLIHAVHRGLGKDRGTHPGAKEKHECGRYQDSIRRKPARKDKARRDRNKGFVGIEDRSNSAFDVRIHAKPAFPSYGSMILQEFDTTVADDLFRRTCPMLLAKA